MEVFKFLLIIALLGTALSENLSSCVGFLKSESIDRNSPDKWYVELQLQSKKNLTGVWIMIVLDKEVDLMGNSFGTTTTKNNKDFMISNDSYHLEEGSVLPISFLVKFKDPMYPPAISKIYMDGRPVCMNNLKDVDVYRTTEFPGSTLDGLYDDDDEQCGIINEMPSPNMLLGQNTSQGQWPWHVAIKVRYNDYDPEYHYVCGGTLITKRHVLTAAHCVCKRGTEERIKKEYFSIFAGLHSLINLDSEVQTRKISRIHVCPEYNPRINYIDDIAVLRLQEPVMITNFVRPVCMWEGQDEINDVLDETGYIAGWGINESGNQSIHLMQAMMPITTFDKCYNRPARSDLRSFCASFASGTVICNGDSGGGLVFPRNKTADGKTVWQIRGIASTSARHGSFCNPKGFAMFADVAKHRFWLEPYLDDGFQFAHS